MPVTSLLGTTSYFICGNGTGHLYVGQLKIDI